MKPLAVLGNDAINGGPVAHRTKEDEDVPNAVEIAAVIVGKEISAACIEQAFCQNPKQGRQG